jgi:hypothetical protein
MRRSTNGPDRGRTLTKSADLGPVATNAKEPAAGTLSTGAPTFRIAARDERTGEIVAEITAPPQRVAGTPSFNVARMLMQQALGTRVNQKDLRGLVEEVCETLQGLGPETAIEGLLCSQMVGVHNLAMEFMRRALLREQTFEGVTAETNRAVRLLRVFVEQADALQRLRGKAGQQKVTVEHVHVNEGGRAIVGAVAITETALGVGDEQENHGNTP